MPHNILVYIHLVENCIISHSHTLYKRVHLVENCVRDRIEIYVMLCEIMCVSRLDHYTTHDCCVSSENLVETYVM